MGVLLALGGAAVVGLAVVRWKLWRLWPLSDPEEYMSETWMKDHVYRSGAKREWSDL